MDLWRSLAQSSSPSKASYKVKSVCSQSCPLTFWKSPSRGIPQPLHLKLFSNWRWARTIQVLRGCLLTQNNWRARPFLHPDIWYSPVLRVITSMTKTQNHSKILKNAQRCSDLQTLYYVPGNLEQLWLSLQKQCKALFWNYNRLADS